MWRLIRSWICHNHKIYYTISIGWAFATYNVWWYTIIGYYRQRNHHRSLDWAIEAEWSAADRRDGVRVRVRVTARVRVPCSPVGHSP